MYYRCIQEHRANRAYRCISIQVYRANRAYRCIQEHRAYRCITDVFKNTELTELTDVLVFKNTELTELTDVLVFKNTELTELTDVLVFKNAELTDDNRAYRCCCCTPLSGKSWNINRACPFCNGWRFRPLYPTADHFAHSTLALDAKRCRSGNVKWEIWDPNLGIEARAAPRRGAGAWVLMARCPKLPAEVETLYSRVQDK